MFETDEVEYGQFADINFIKNQGQWSEPFLYKANMGSISLFAEKHALTYSLTDPADMGHHGTHRGHHHAHANEVNRHGLRVNFEGASSTSSIVGQDKREVYHNYYLGADESKWKSQVPIHGNILYKNLYENIHMKIYQTDGFLKYDFVVLPGGNADKIKMKYEGADKLFLKKGALHIETSVTTIVEKRPYAYQYIGDKKVEVSCKFVLSDDEVTFKFPKGFNSDYELIIDPILIFSTFSGSTADNFGTTATFDLSGNGYGAGTVYDMGYPTTLGAFQTDFNDGTIDAAISKFSADGTSLIFSTYLGGTGPDVPHSLIVNSRDELIVMGSTGSQDFPARATSFDNTFNGGQFQLTLGVNPNLEFRIGSDIFVSKFRPNGSALLGSTYLGGGGNDGINSSDVLLLNYADEFRGEVIVDDNDEIYIASTTRSTGFPTTPGAFDEVYNGGSYDGIVSKFNSDLSNLIWSTYFGGSGDDVAYSMKIDDQRNVYFTGGTTSQDLPTSPQAINSTYRGGEADGYLGQLSANGGALPTCTYLGTSNYDQSYLIELDPDDQIYAVGYSRSGSYPITPGRYADPNSVQFMHKLKPDLDSTFFSSQFGNGGNGRLSLNALMIDDCYRIYISGWFGRVNTNPSDVSVFDFPVTNDAFQRTTDGSDFYFTVFEPDMRALEYATYFGGATALEHVDGGTSRFDRRGIIYQAVCAGCGGISDFPTSSSAFSRINGTGASGSDIGGCNMAIVKFDFQLDEIIVDATVNPDVSGCAPFVVQFNNLSRGPVDIFEWDFGDNTTSDETNPMKTYDAGTYQIMLIGKSEFDCVDPDTAIITINVFDPDDTSDEIIFKCFEDPVTLESKNLSAGAEYVWQDGTTTTQTFTASDPGVYFVKTLSNLGCFIDSFEVRNLPIPSSSTVIEGCVREDYTLRPPSLDPSLGFLWSDGTSGDFLIVRESGIYWVQSLDPANCDRIDSFIVDEYPLKDPIVNDFPLCPGKSTDLQSSDLDAGLTYLWNDGTTDNSITINSAGVYAVTTTYPAECELIDSFFVRPDSIRVITLDSLRICEGTMTTLSSQVVGEGASYMWSTGETTATINVDRTGLYEVITDYDRLCPTTNRYFVRAFPVIDNNDVYFPNAFSPNNDGINDVFEPYFSDLVTVLDYDLKIFNRWGQKVFETESTNRGWDGFDLKREEAVAVFAYYAEINVISCDGNPLLLFFEGDISLIK